MIQPNVLRLLVMRSLFKHNEQIKIIEGNVSVHIFLESPEQILKDLSKQLKNDLKEVFDNTTPDTTVSQFIKSIYTHLESQNQ